MYPTTYLFSPALRLILVISLIGVCVSCAPSPTPTASTATPVAAYLPPNVIFIMADDLGYADIGPYGQEKIATPVLDSLAAQGMRFTQFYAGSSVCAPSRAVLLTGLHTGHTEIRGNKQYQRRNGQYPLTPGIPTLASVLQDAGYATGMIGKWGLGDPNTVGKPANHGFDYFFGYTDQVLAHNYWPEYLWENDQRVDLDNEVQYLDSTAWHQGLGSITTGRVDYAQDLFLAKAKTFITDHQNEPFFLYLPVTTPHDNGEQPADQRFEVPEQGTYADRDWTENQKNYAAMISRLDGNIGELLALLAELNLEKETLVVFTSDNGPLRQHPTTDFFDSNGALRGGKRDLYEGGIRVPFIARWPGAIAPGTTSEYPAALWDMLPTLAELARQTVPDSLDGRSILPVLTGVDKTAPPAYLYWEFHEGEGAQAIRQGDWKAVRNGIHANPNAPIELYNLATDLSETQNVAAQHPEQVAELTRLLESARTPSSLFPIGK